MEKVSKDIRERTKAGDDRYRAADLDDKQEAAGSLPVKRKIADLRSLLHEPDGARGVDDWGRSERVERLLDRVAYSFLYRYWFRCEVEGIENVPEAGGALLVANHSGLIAAAAPMIVKAIAEEHRRPRPVYVTVDHSFKGFPGFSMLTTKLGCVAAHPANVHRLLFDEGQLVLVFPEGRRAAVKLYRDRYRLRRFGRGGFVAAAVGAGTPLVPVCVMGAEEASPVFTNARYLSRLAGLPPLPVTPTWPWMGLVGMIAYLPAKFRIRFLEPVEPDGFGCDPGRDKARVQTVAHEIRARIQKNLYEMVERRGSVWFG